MERPDDPDFLALPGYATPEEAAVEGYSAASNVRVLSVERESDNYVRVVIDTEPSHPMLSHCERGSDGLWRETASSN